MISQLGEAVEWRRQVGVSQTSVMRGVLCKNLQETWITSFFHAVIRRCQQGAENIDHLRRRSFSTHEAPFRYKLWSLSFVFTTSIFISHNNMTICMFCDIQIAIKYFKSLFFCHNFVLWVNALCCAALCSCRCRSQSNHTSCRNAAATEWFMCCMLELLQKFGIEEVFNYSFGSGFLGILTTMTRAGVNPVCVMFVLINS